MCEVGRIAASLFNGEPDSRQDGARRLRCARNGVDREVLAANDFGGNRFHRLLGDVFRFHVLADFDRLDGLIGEFDRHFNHAVVARRADRVGTSLEGGRGIGRTGGTGKHGDRGDDRSGYRRLLESQGKQLNLLIEASGSRAAKRA